MSLHISSHFRLRSALICFVVVLLPFGAQAIEPSQTRNPNASSSRVIRPSRGWRSLATLYGRAASPR